MDWSIYVQEQGSVINAQKLLATHLPRINTIRDHELRELAEAFGVDYRKDFLS